MELLPTSDELPEGNTKCKIEVTKVFPEAQGMNNEELKPYHKKVGDAIKVIAMMQENDRKKAIKEHKKELSKMSIEEVKASYADDLRQATDEEFKQVHEELFKEQSKEYRDFMMDIFEAEKKRRNL